MKELEIQWPHTKLWPNRKHHWRVKHQLRREWWTNTYWLARKHDFNASKASKLHIIFHPPSKRKFDLDNALAALKGQIDAIAYYSRCDDSQWSYEVSKGEVVKGGKVVIRIVE